MKTKSYFFMLLLLVLKQEQKPNIRQPMSYSMFFLQK